MGLLTVLLIAVGLAMDAFAVSVASGIVIGDVRLRHGLKFGLYFGVFQFIMPLIGWLAASRFADRIEAIDHWIAFILLAVIGGRMIWASIGQEDPETPPKSREKLLSTRNMLILAVATSIDALAVGISFAVLDTDILVSSLIIGLVAFTFSLCGIFLGKRLGALTGKRVEVLGGVILIAIGLKILIEHLFF